MTACLSGLLMMGPITALGQRTVTEDFESYTVSVLLDPTTVGNSGWTRDGVGASDWDVICCDGDIPSLDRTFDGSRQFLALRRSRNNSPQFTDENTDFALPTIVEGYVSLELDPKDSSQPGISMALFDSGSGSNAMKIIFTEAGFAHKVENSADFRVFDENDDVLAEGRVLNDPDGVASVDRWYKILFTLHGNGTYDINIFDIGPTIPQGNIQNYNDPARGNVLSLNGVNLPVPSIDTFRLTPGATNSDGLQPALIDNIIASDFLGTPIEVDLIKQGAEISFPTQAGKVYQAQYSDPPSGIWTDFGALLLGDGNIQSVVISTTGAPEDRTYRVQEF